jgi:hypothetical protein
VAELSCLGNLISFIVWRSGQVLQIMSIGSVDLPSDFICAQHRAEHASKAEGVELELTFCVTKSEPTCMTFWQLLFEQLEVQRAPSG